MVKHGITTSVTKGKLIANQGPEQLCVTPNVLGYFGWCGDSGALVIPEVTNMIVGIIIAKYPDEPLDPLCQSPWNSSCVRNSPCARSPSKKIASKFRINGINIFQIKNFNTLVQFNW